MNASDLGKRIADLRNERKMTQTELADKLSVSTQAISKWETGAGFPDIQIIPQLAEIFNTTADFLLGCEKKQKILYKNPKRLLQIRKTNAIILVYDSRKCERGGNASLSY